MAIIKVISELLILIKWLISTHKAERFREDVEVIKSDPSDSWSKRFGRVQHNQRGRINSELVDTARELSALDSKSP